MEVGENLPRLFTLRALICAAAEEKTRFDRSAEKRNRAERRRRRDADALTLLDRTFSIDCETVKRTEIEKYKRYSNYSGAFIGKTLLKFAVVVSVLTAIAAAVWAVGSRSVFVNSEDEYAVRIAIAVVAALAAATAVVYGVFCVSGIVLKKRREFREYVELCSNDRLDAIRKERVYAERKQKLEARAEESERLSREANAKFCDGKQNVSVILSTAIRRYPELPPPRWELLDATAYLLLQSNASTSDDALFLAESGKSASENAEVIKFLAEAGTERQNKAAYRDELMEAQAELAEHGIEISLTDALSKRRAEPTAEILGSLGSLVGSEAVSVRIPAEETA